MRFLKSAFAPINWLLTVLYLWRRGVKYTGKVPYMNMLNPPKFEGEGRIDIGSGVKFMTHMQIRSKIECDVEGETITYESNSTTIRVDRGAKLLIGNDVTFNNVLWIRARGCIEIGDYVQIGPGVIILDSNLHQMFPDDKQIPRPTVLERNCVVFPFAQITSVRIGKHSVISPKSSVKRDVPEKVKVEGNPALVVGTVDCPDDWVRDQVTW